MKKMNKKILLAGLCLVSSSVFAQTVDLGDLYSRYEQADFSSMELPEYNQTIAFQAVIVSSEQNLEGGALLEIGSVQEPETTLARITPADSEAAKFAKLKSGQKVKLECNVEMTMGSDCLGLGDCTLK